jgi:hypothetical protein
MTLQEAQSDLRWAYLCGVPGVFVSGCVWLAASGVAAAVSHRAGVFALLLGGAAIHPLSVLLSKLLGRSGAKPGHRLKAEPQRGGREPTANLGVIPRPTQAVSNLRLIAYRY